MATVRGVTARFLGGYKSPQTRLRYKKDIMLWQKFCEENAVHPLDARAVNCQAFIDWLSGRCSPASVRARRSGVSSWFNALVRARIIPANGMLGVDLPERDEKPVYACVVSDEDVSRIMEHVSQLGPRWEWLVGMVVYGGCDVAEALRVRGADVSTREGRTTIHVRTRHGSVRRIPVDGRLEVLTIGLSQVFAASSPLSGLTNNQHASNKLANVVSEAVGRRVTAQDLRRFAVKRQADRGVSPEVIARWLGHSEDRWVRRTLGLDSSVAGVSWEDVTNSIVVEIDGGRFGSGNEPDSTILDVPSPIL